MVSGVSFKNPNENQRNVRRSGGISSGILFSVLLLVAVGVVYAIAFFFAAQQTSKNVSLTDSQQSNQKLIDEALQGAPAEFIAKSRALGSERYTDSTTSTILREFHKLLIPGIVFQTFEHSVDKKTQVASIKITADASDLNTLAAQVEAWKGSPLFSRVRTDGASKDAESGFIEFTTEFVLSPSVVEEQ